MRSSNTELQHKTCNRCLFSKDMKLVYSPKPQGGENDFSAIGLIILSFGACSLFLMPTSLSFTSLLLSASFISLSPHFSSLYNYHMDWWPPRGHLLWPQHTRKHPQLFDHGFYLSGANNNHPPVCAEWNTNHWQAHEMRRCDFENTVMHELPLEVTNLSLYINEVLMLRVACRVVC